MKLLHNHLKIIVLFVLLLSISCDEKKDIIVKKVKTTKKDLKKNTLENEFTLSDDNVMEFFLEYDKNHKENKVRIFTEYGEIDILLFENTKFHRSNFIYLTKKNYFLLTSHRQENVDNPDKLKDLTSTLNTICQFKKKKNYLANSSKNKN